MLYVTAAKLGYGTDYIVYVRTVSHRVVFGQARDICQHSGSGWSNLDACFSIFERYAFKIYMLVMRDGNNKDTPIGFGIYEQETIVNYSDFISGRPHQSAHHCHLHGPPHFAACRMCGNFAAIAP
jgi:hypothetical protein